MSHRRLASRLGALAAVATVAAGLAAPAAAVDKELKLAHFVPPAHILHSTLWPDMIKRIEAASSGRLKVTIYPSGQLLKINETYDGLRNGVADIGYVLFGATPGRFPAVSVAELPFLFPDAKVGSRAIMQLAATGAFAKELGDVVPLYLHAIDLHGLHVRSKPIRRPEDIKGLRIRFGSAPARDLLAAYGAIPVGVAAPQLYENLEKGVIDGMTGGWDAMISLRLGEVVKSHLDMSLYTMVFCLCMSKSSLDALAPELRKAILDNAGIVEAERVGEALDKAAKEGRDFVVAAKHTVPPLSAADVKAWEDGAKPMIDAYIDQLEKSGVKAREHYRFLQEAGKK